MNINELAKTHGFKKDVDYWQHKQSGQWILKHDAITKIANAENIKLVKIVSLYQSDTCVRFLVTMGLFVDDNIVNQITSVGEADTNSCFMPYLGCIAEKRGIDRCVLKLINAYEYGISSEEEAEDYKQTEKPKPIPENVNPIEIPAEQIEVGAGISGIEVRDDIKLTFGKFKGQMISECDTGYLEWLSGPKAEKSLAFFDDKSKIKEIQDAAGYFLFKLKQDDKIPF